MHRHLVGLDSPPSEYLPDPMTLGPVLPEGWDGDAWISPRGDGYFLRAWNKGSGRIALSRSDTYQGARKSLIADIVDGTMKVTVSVQEAAPPAGRKRAPSSKSK